jgi:LmbE family N-acetylglucosaminyl deacetylase
MATGRDVTSETERLSCLVLAPHPDDETLGCGATIARKRALGTHVHVAIAADGRYAQKASDVISVAEMAEIRAHEATAACRRLGVDSSDLTQLQYEDTRLQQRFDSLVEQLITLVVEVAPDEVLMVSRWDHHPDHRTLNEAARAALSIVRFAGRVAEYPVWYWVDGPWLGLSERPLLKRAGHLVAAPGVSLVTSHVELRSTAGFLSVKRAALDAYTSQVTNMTGESQWGVMDNAFLANFLMPHEPFFTALD